MKNKPHKYIFSLLWAVLLIILLHACQQDDLTPPSPKVEEVTVVFEQPNMVTRSSEGENVIHDFWFFQFDHTERLVQKPVFYDIQHFSGKVPLMKMGSGQDYDCIFIANAGSEAFHDLYNEKIWRTYTFDDLKDAHAPFTNYYGEHPMLMSGEGLEIDNDGVTKTRVSDHTTKMTCTLRHNAAKVMLTVNLPLTNLADSHFSLHEIRLNNVPHHLRYYHIDDVDAKDSDYIETQSLITFTYQEDEVTPQVLLHPEKGQSFTTTLYLPSNPKGGYTNPDGPEKRKDNAPAGATNLMLRIDYGEHRERPVNYHIFVGKNITDYNVLSNHSYTINATIHGYNKSDPDSRIEFLYDIVTEYIGMADYHGQWGENGFHPLGDTYLDPTLSTNGQ